MTEQQIQRIEHELETAGPEAAAAIAVAAITRIGDLGRPAGEAFGKLASGHDDDFERVDFSEGMAWLADYAA